VVREYLQNMVELDRELPLRAVLAPRSFGLSRRLVPADDAHTINAVADGLSAALAGCGRHQREYAHAARTP